MKYSFTITLEREGVPHKVTDDRTLDKTYPTLAELEHGVVFWWKEGNGSCDCNRILALLKWDDTNFAEDEPECGETIKLLSIVNETTGKKLV